MKDAELWESRLIVKWNRKPVRKRDRREGEGGWLLQGSDNWMTSSAARYSRRRGAVEVVAVGDGTM